MIAQVQSVGMDGEQEFFMIADPGETNLANVHVVSLKNVEHRDWLTVKLVVQPCLLDVEAAARGVIFNATD